MALRIRRGLENDLPNALLGEPLYCTDTHKLFIGQGEDKAPRDLCEKYGNVDTKLQDLKTELTVDDSDIDDILNMINNLD